MRGPLGNPPTKRDTRTAVARRGHRFDSQVLGNTFATQNVERLNVDLIEKAIMCARAHVKDDGGSRVEKNKKIRRLVAGDSAP